MSHPRYEFMSRLWIETICSNEISYFISTQQNRRHQYSSILSLHHFTFLHLCSFWLIRKCFDIHTRDDCKLFAQCRTSASASGPSHIWWFWTLSFTISTTRQLSLVLYSHMMTISSPSKSHHSFFNYTKNTWEFEDRHVRID
jgi:hypothetical protein